MAKCTSCEDRGWILARGALSLHSRHTYADARGYIEAETFLHEHVGRIIECPALCAAAISHARVLYRRPLATA